MQIDVVVPARRVEGVTLERLHPVDACELRCRQDAVGKDHVARPHRVAAIGEDRPRLLSFVPFCALHRGVEEAALEEPEALGHRLAVLEDSEPDANFIDGT